MAVTLLEKIDSRESSTGKNAAVDFKFLVTGTSSDTEAKTALAAGTAVYYDGLIRQTVHVEPLSDPTMTNAWSGTVRYGLHDEAETETGETSFSFDTGGGSQHITQSLETVGSYAPEGETAPDFAGAIGVTRDNVEGVDITVPVYNFTETHYLSAAQVTTAYKGTLFRLTGKVNSDSFREFDAGEVLFLGASGARRGTSADDDWEITYRFAALPNKTGITVGDITGIAKKGWEYLWVRYIDDVDDTAKMLIKKPVAAYVEKVYEDSAFSVLEIGSES